MRDVLKDRIASGVKPEAPSAARRPPVLVLMGLLFPATLVGGMVLFPARANLGRLSEKDSPLRIGIDPNSTHWFELAQLPGIGESLARKIVDYRESRRGSSQVSNRPVFATPEDLLPVNGIGVRLLARIRPFLIFPSPLPGQVDSLSLSR